jgi:anaerobic ribonucleoside-triphosphate reductase activating protein
MHKYNNFQRFSDKSIKHVIFTSIWNFRARKMVFNRFDKAYIAVYHETRCDPDCRIRRCFMHYGALKPIDIANGPGCRVSLFVSGCTNACPGCFQPQTWDFTYGNEYTEEVQKQILSALAPSYIQGLTVLGGEPFEIASQPYVAALLQEVKAKYPDKDIWCYTGFILEKDLQKGGRRYTEYTDTILENLDVLVDGPFVQEKKNIALPFRGSENQRLLDLNAMRKEKKVVLVDPELFK